MQSFPVIRLLVVTFALALTAIAVWNVTHPVTVAVGPSAVPPTAVTRPLRSVVVDLTFSQVPAEYEIITGQGAAIKAVSMTSECRVKIEQSLPVDGADWIVRARWKNKSVPAAVRVQCRDADSSQKLGEATLWGKGEVEDSISLK